MVPIFKTNYSIGKSIFTLSEHPVKDGPPSLLKLAKEEKLKSVLLIEDCATGFPEAFKAFKKTSIQLIFGLRFDFGSKDSVSKLVAIAKNDDGIKAINSLHTEYYTTGFVSQGFLRSVSSNIDVCVPFYDSFMYKNVMEFGDYICDLKEFSPTFFIEDNELPFDKLVSEKVVKFCETFGYDTLPVKSIYYEKRDDAEALQTYKIITNRNTGRNYTLSRPNLDHFGSREFCWESYKEKVSE